MSAKLGDLTLAADFVGHSVPTLQGPLTSEDYVVVEAAFFGPSGAKLAVSWENFSVKINGKKTGTPAQPVGFVLRSLKDPEWIPPEPPEGSGGKSKGGLSGGGGGQAGEPKPDPPKMPLPLRRIMEQKAQKSAYPEGERVLPQAGLFFFSYRGKDTGIQTVELTYEGPAGKATIVFNQ